ncbi:MAG: ACP S-malonyltransferase [Lachnospiraceae bacterium]|nr:ACP S-malonyltransferase [Lachnospiraceae bacterium]
MSKIAFVFPGQGAQYGGMGRDFYESRMESRRVFQEMSEACGMDLPKLCFTENEMLSITSYTQIAMLAVEAAILAAVRELGIIPSVTAGLSLGEYGALLASGVMETADAARVVAKRGQYMQEAVPEGGAMSAVLGLEAEKIEAVLRQLGEERADGTIDLERSKEKEGPVYIANYNCPGQIVISGEAKGVAAATEALKNAGARRVLPLHVSGPFHTPLLYQAGERLEEALKPVSLRNMEIPYVSNVTADYVRDTGKVKELLKRQVVSSVRWQQSVERMLADGVDTFVEIGPGHTLTGFLKKIDKSARGISLEKLEDLEKLRGL